MLSSTRRPNVPNTSGDTFKVRVTGSTADGALNGNVITAMAASNNFDVDIPPGFYHIGIAAWGTGIATSAVTIKPYNLVSATKAVQSVKPYSIMLTNVTTTVTVISVATGTVAANGRIVNIHMPTSGVSDPVVFISNGLRLVVAKATANAGTLDIEVVVQRV